MTYPMTAFLGNSNLVSLYLKKKIFSGLLSWSQRRTAEGEKMLGDNFLELYKHCRTFLNYTNTVELSRTIQTLQNFLELYKHCRTFLNYTNTAELSRTIQTLQAKKTVGIVCL